MAGPLLTVRLRDTGMRNRIRDIKGHYTGFQKQVGAANARSVHWLQKRSVGYLNASMRAHGRPDEAHSGRLEAAIKNDANSEWSNRHFSFLIHERIKEQSPYYRAIEQGSGHMVGRRIPLMFIAPGGGIVPADRWRYPQDVGRFAPGRTRPVLIRNPIPAYHYAERAISVFQDLNLYSTYIEEAAREYSRATGIKLSMRR